MAASMAASKLQNLRSPALQALLRRHLLHPSASASLQPTSTNLFHLENVGNDSSSVRNSNFHVSNFPLNLQLPFGSPVMQIEAARTYNPSTTKDDDDDVEEDEDDGFDDEADEDDIENFSGSDFDDEDEDDDDDEAAARLPSRK